MKSFQLLLPAIRTRTTVDFRFSRCYSSVKKDTSQPIALAYNPKAVESGWYKWWEENGFFRRSDAQEKFVMILPPPNITGHLHLGHALTCAIQDVLARWHQMNGRRVVWVPGCDHAGIATQVVVERHLWATKQVTRHQLGRERFIDEILEWKEQKGTTIYDQMKRLGVSLDWDRAIYTMDENMSKSVSEAFIKLFNAGLVYRKMSLVNWCCELQSAISNIEVEHLELEGPTPLRVPGYEQPVTFGKMYDFAYEVSGSDEVIVVSTTRPETMLGDTAVMVNPADGRYAHLVGKKARHPFRQEEIRIIADEHVNPDFGTGAVKVTPAHSAHDFEVGLRHDLPRITIFDERGQITLSEFRGQPRFTARDSVLDALDQLGLYRGCKPHPMVVPVCSRTNDIIEPLLKPQWYVNVTEMARAAAAAVESGDLEIYPRNYKAVWHEWLGKNVQDWCISRQLWWGHRIPAFRVECDDGAEEVTWVAAASEEEAKKIFLKKYELSETQIRGIKQDDDVLDTWFSSGLLPFAAFGWPQDTCDYDQLYPTSLLETGHDILFFWVGRMVMLGLQLTGKLPFKTVVLHGLIHDAQGQKMSKSKGNVIDPMDVIDGATLEALQSRIAENEDQGVLTRQGAEEAYKQQVASYPKGIPECGADALRLSLCSYSLENQFVAVDVNRMEHHKFLGNKIWQVMRFLLSALNGIPEECCSSVTSSQIDNLTVMDRWVLSQLSQLVSSAQKNIPIFNLHHVVVQFEHFWYKCLCDVYLESIKPALRSGEAGPRNASFQVLWTCVDACLRLASPFMPFLTEELYQRLPRHRGKEESILQCRYPREDEWDCWRNVHLEDQVKVLLEVVTSLRSMKSTYGIEGHRHKVQGSLITQDQSLASFLEDSVSVVETLARVGSFTIIEAAEGPPAGSAVATVSDKTSVYLHLEGLIDPAVEIERLEKKILKLKKSESEMLKKMEHKRFKLRTPLSVQESMENKLSTIRKEMEQVTSLIRTMEGL
ncbi:valine--tRNA ligase-like [Palaemon carinicauda]|uniref:valine--tRNA ligase-like n=1 Tax=Palaemon carinicauda TaxID=392227 RepID=UPI0035B6934D